MTTRINSRASWGAADAKRTRFMDPKNVQAIYLHWNGKYITLTGPALMRTIQRVHLRDVYYDFAYSFGVDQKGAVYEGRGFTVEDGATDRSVAGKSYSIYMGIGPGQKIPVAMLEGVVNLVEEINERVGRRLPVKPHRAAHRTTCPGDELTEWIRRGLPVAADKPVIRPIKAVKPAALSRVKPDLPALGSAILRGGDWRNALPWRKARVNALQLALGYLGYGLVGTGPWGPKTTDALKSFQLHAHIKVDGIAGPQTWGALRDALVKA